MGGGTPQAITLGRWEIRTDSVYYNGLRCQLSPQESRAVYAVARGDGEYVRNRDVGQFACPASVDPYAIGRINIGRAKKRLPSLPIVSTPWLGHAWSERPQAYTGPYPIRTHRNEAEIAAGDDALLRRLEYARRDVERLTAEALARGLTIPEPERSHSLPPVAASASRPGNVHNSAGAATLCDPEPLGAFDDLAFHGAVDSRERQHDHG